MYLTTITTKILHNGLPLHRIAVEGTRAVTLLVTFDAGARTERGRHVAHLDHHALVPERVTGERTDRAAALRAVNDEPCRARFTTWRST